MKKILLALLPLFFVAGAHADMCNPCKPVCSPCDPCEPICWSFCDIQDPCTCQTFVYGGANYSSSSKFHGWGGTWGIGRDIYIHHAATLELNYFHMDANSRVDTAVRSGESREWALMVNYRYHSSLAQLWCGCDDDWSKRIQLFAGAGLGINMARTYDSYTALDVPTPTPVDTRRSKNSFAGQIFGGVGFVLTDNIFFTTGLRGFFTEKYDFKSVNPALAPLNTDAARFVVDLGLVIHW